VDHVTGAADLALVVGAAFARPTARRLPVGARGGLLADPTFVEMLAVHVIATISSYSQMS
jgi:hypothetical protein